MFSSIAKSGDKISSGLVGNDRKVFWILCLVVALLIVDTMTHYVSDLIVPALISLPSIIVFTIIVCVTAFGQYVILEYTRSKSREIRNKDHHIRVTQGIVASAQFAMIAIALAVTVEILFTSQYHTVLLSAVAVIIATVSPGILGLFAFKLFSWFRFDRSSIIVLLYGLSFSITALSIPLNHFRDIYLLSTTKSPVINSSSPVIFPYDFLEPGSLLDLIFVAYNYLDTLGFGLLIAATAILLHHYSKRIGKIKFWIYVTLPLVYNVSTSLEIIGLYTPVTDSEWFYWWLYVSLNSTAGGILFGLAFITIAKTIRPDSSVRQYMTIAAYGFVIMFVSNQVVLVGASYPPVGLITLSFLPLASYMIFVGVYSTAVSVSQDNRLRQSIKKIVAKDSNLLSSIGTAQMEREIQRTVNSLKDVVLEQEKELEEQTGIETNMEEDEMKNYLEQVMQEVGKTKSQ